LSLLWPLLANGLDLHRADCDARVGPNAPRCKCLPRRRVVWPDREGRERPCAPNHATGTRDSSAWAVEDVGVQRRWAFNCLQVKQDTPPSPPPTRRETRETRGVLRQPRRRRAIRPHPLSHQPRTNPTPSPLAMSRLLAFQAGALLDSMIDQDETQSESVKLPASRPCFGPRVERGNAGANKKQQKLSRRKFVAAIQTKGADRSTEIAQGIYAQNLKYLTRQHKGVKRETLTKVIDAHHNRKKPEVAEAEEEEDWSIFTLVAKEEARLKAEAKAKVADAKAKARGNGRRKGAKSKAKGRPGKGGPKFDPYGKIM